MARTHASYPERVAATLERLRKETRSKITLSMIRGRFCAYEYKYIAMPGSPYTKVKKQFYIGWIDRQGDFHQAVHRAGVTQSKGIDEYIEKSVGLSKEYEAAHVDSTDSAILELLSKDARMPVPLIAKRVGISPGAAYYRIKNLFRQYGIKKTIEIYPKIFGFYRFVVNVKFVSAQPDYSKLKELLSAEPLIQMVALMRGDSDLLIYMLAGSVEEVEETIYRIRSDSVFSGTSSLWNVGYLIEWHGYIPLRDEFFKLLEGRVWRKSRDSPRRRGDQLLLSEYAVLRELNSDGGTEFTKIDEKYGLVRGNAQYTYRRLLDRHIIERATIIAKKPNCRFSLLIYLKQFDVLSFNRDRQKYIAYTRDEIAGAPFNKFALAGDVSAPYGEMLLMPVFGYSQEGADSWFRRNVRGIEACVSVITDYLVGYPGFRKLLHTQAEELAQYNANK